MADSIIKVNNLTKSFIVPHERHDTLRSRFFNLFKKIPKDTFDALKDIDFEIKKGEFVGIIGRNGSGKSTLLKLIAGVYEPTKGSVEVNGNLVPFLELGVGFNTELTGRENIFLNGTILGMTYEFMESKMDEIIEFAELEKFIDMQTKNYSSGMMMRLAFSVAAQVKADIYLLDEVLGVGDAGFQEKSLKKMKELLSGGSTVLYVSHSAASIKEHCDRVIYLQNSHKVFDGDTDKGLVHYELSFLESEEAKKKYLKNNRAQEIESLFMQKKAKIDKKYKYKTEIEKILAYEKYKLKLMNKDDGELFKMQVKKVKQLENTVEKELVSTQKVRGSVRNAAKLLKFELLNINEVSANKFKPGDSFKVNVKFEIIEFIERPVIGVSIQKYSIPLQVINTPRLKNEILKPLNKGDIINVSFDGLIQLNPEVYDIQVHFGDPKIHGGGTCTFAYIDKNIATLTVYSDKVLDPSIWDFNDNPQNYSGFVRNNFNYKINIKHE